MHYLVFDVESTGLSGNAEVVQFAGLLLNEEFRLQRLIHFYCYTQVPMEPKAMEITGLTPELLMELSHGKTFEDHFLNLEVLSFKDLIWVAYNDSFDIRVINNTLRRNGLDMYNFGNSLSSLDKTSGVYHFDLMKALAAKNGGIPRKLHEVAASLSYSKETLDSMYKKLLTLANVKSSVDYHNAIYDTMITMLLLIQNRQWCY